MIVECEAGSWERVLSQTRAVNASPRGKYDLRLYWRVLAYRAYEGEPEPIVRAQAFASVLDNIPMHCYECDVFAGSTAGFTSDASPDGVSEEEFAQIQTEHWARPQRSFVTGWDHTLADYPTLLSVGIGGLLRRVDESSANHTCEDEQVFLRAVRIVLEAFSRFVLRYARAFRERGDGDVVERLERIAMEPPRSLPEAMQLVWLTHIAFSSEGRYHMALGRIDQYLLPFYVRDRDAGLTTRGDALELFCNLWAKIEEMGEVTNICVGGLTPAGDDATNELTYLCIEATRQVQSPHTNLSARFHDGSPEEFHRACFECIKTGVGFPAIFNDHVLLPGLEEVGIPPEVARDYCMVGCIETMLAGRQQAWSDCRFNTPLFLLSAMQRMREEPERSYDRLLELLKEDLRVGIREHCAEIDRHYTAVTPEQHPDPFLSALTRDCIARAKDINDGGAQYQRFIGVCVMGLATMADSLAAVKKLVFEENALDYDELMDALHANYEGNERLRQMLLNRAPKYGNDEPYVDDIAAWLVEYTSDEMLRHKVSTGGLYVSAMGSNVSNIYAGKEVGATPDGREAFTPLSDAASPYYGRDAKGPTAFLKSVARPDYHRVLTGSVVNMKFEPDHFQGEEGAKRFAAMTHWFVRGRIHELQFNFTGNAVLSDAIEHPERYAGLVVRVSGFSAYFTRLAPEVQQDILRRRAHV